MKVFPANMSMATSVAAGLLLSAAATIGIASPAVASGPTVASPDGKVKWELSGAPAQLEYRITLEGDDVIEPSKLAMLVDGTDLSRGVEIETTEYYDVDERYPWFGGHSPAVDHCRGMKVGVKHVASGTQYTLEVRAYDNGIAFRHVIPGDGERVPDEAHQFTIPEQSTVWHHDFHGHYEGVHSRNSVADIDDGTWCAPPLTVRLPGQNGYAAITEGALIGYAGMGLQSQGRAFVTRLGHAQPVNYPFELRFGDDEAKRLAEPAAVSGEIVTPWRIVMVGAELDALVNCDIAANVSPPPDDELFPEGNDTAWLKPGRSVWKYLDGGESSLEGMKQFSRLAGELGFEYNLVEGFWRRWTNDQLRELVDYSRQRGVGIILWHHSGRLRTPEARREFFEMCHESGVAGVKIDFLDHEAKEIIDLYPALLRGAAEQQLIVDFHGANKPAGESRTWPNEMTREAIAGMERSRMSHRAVHDATLPFTRYLAGHADYTAVHFGDRRADTTWAHQIATAAVFTSPLLVYGAHPQRLLDNPAVEVIKSIPSTWDETIALPQSKIGELAAFARRHGNVWFLAILNGEEPKSVEVPLEFLADGEHPASIVRDGADGPTSVIVEQSMARSGDSVTVDLAAGGGFIARFDPP